MSSKAQLQDYVKRLKKDKDDFFHKIGRLKEENQRLETRIIELEYKLDLYKTSFLKSITLLKSSRKKQRKWYHFF